MPSVGYVTTWKPRCSPTNQEGVLLLRLIFWVFPQFNPPMHIRPEDCRHEAFTHSPLPPSSVMHHTHDQKQWLKLCDRVNFQAKFPAERGTERCEEKAPVERKDTWTWQPSACGRTGLDVGASQNHTRGSCYKPVQIFIPGSPGTPNSNLASA